MGEWGIALVAACSAVAGSLVTGWFTRSAGSRQAAAARHAGDRQADALLDTVRMTLEEQRAVRTLDQRRQTYVRFLDAAETAILTRTTGEGHADDRAALQRAYGAVLLEGPDDAAGAARDLLGCLRGTATASLDDLERARLAFVAAARTALDDDGPDAAPVRVS
ncbi:hypothetical protein DVA86_22210 [Streptomyces armeniacus]|uniref:Uncharacterized protein n=1 Tax=Streptomyces armeniacus TaxID=83291 RepID=A0A345XTI6_9ACTN|nr:hypothetical protein [Streptomyces armeniacus]AXK34952.1 hypothetical protein DVA86_22210 [Streptomyces armeniacus]